MARKAGFASRDRARPSRNGVAFDAEAADLDAIVLELAKLRERLKPEHHTTPVPKNPRRATSILHGAPPTT
jgi:hypothetical protein